MQSPPRIAPQTEPLAQPLADRMARLIPSGMAAPQLFLTTARNEGLFMHMVDTGWIGPTGLMDRKALPKILREAIILRTCVATGNDYEFNLHVQTISQRMGLTDEQIDDVRAAQPQSGLWPAGYTSVFRLVDGLALRLEVADATFTSVKLHFDDAVLIEMTQLVGLYVGVAMQVALARPAFDAYRPGPPALTERVRKI